MYQGEFQHTIDSKGRLTLPAKIREELGAQFILTKGFEGCLSIYDQGSWDAFLEKLNTLPTSSPKARKLRRFILGSSVECEPDKQGRILISPVLRDFAGMDKNITVLGVADHVELWSTEEYEAYQNDSDESIEDIAAEFGF